MSFDQAIETLSRDERFKATVYAMNTLLIQKNVYSQQEFEELFVQWAQKELRKRPDSDRIASSIPAIR